MENVDEIARIYPQAAGIGHDTALSALEAYQELGIKVHPGAERYYKEVGVM
jgi:TRAP-type uncharacterized transport system substrate-binding protein